MCGVGQGWLWVLGALFCGEGWLSHTIHSLATHRHTIYTLPSRHHTIHSLPTHTHTHHPSPPSQVRDLEAFVGRPGCHTPSIHTPLTHTIHTHTQVRDLESFFEPLFAFYKAGRKSSAECFGDFCARVGFDALREYSVGYVPSQKQGELPQVGWDGGVVCVCVYVLGKGGGKVQRRWTEMNK